MFYSLVIIILVILGGWYLVKNLNDNSGSALNPQVSIYNVSPSGSVYMQGEGAMIPLSWELRNIPAGATIYLSLLSSNGTESLGRITNNPDCSRGGDTLAMQPSVNMYKWDGLFICQNWQAHPVSPGNYNLGVSIYTQDGIKILANGKSATPFNLVDKLPK